MIYRSRPFVGWLRTYAHNWSKVLFALIRTFTAGGAVERRLKLQVNQQVKLIPKLLICVPSCVIHVINTSIDQKHLVAYAQRRCGRFVLIFEKLYRRVRFMSSFSFGSFSFLRVFIWCMHLYVESLKANPSVTQTKNIHINNVIILNLHNNGSR